MLSSQKMLVTMWMIFLCACGTISPSPGVSNTTQIAETETKTNIIDREIIRLNNCGGSRDAEQISQRSIAINLEGEVAVGTDIKMVEAQIRAKYSWIRTNDKSMKVSAAPGTNMEITLVWVEQQWFGTVTFPEGPEATYIVRAPLSVEQESAVDLICPSITNPGQISQSPTQPTTVPVPTRPASMPVVTAKPAAPQQQPTLPPPPTPTETLLVSVVPENSQVAAAKWGGKAEWWTPLFTNGWVLRADYPISIQVEPGWRIDYTDPNGNVKSCEKGSPVPGIYGSVIVLTGFATLWYVPGETQCSR